MTHRIRVATIAFVAVFALMLAAPSYAGPDPHHPAQRNLTAQQAYAAASYHARLIFARMLPKPNYGWVGRCTQADGPRIWRCQTGSRGKDVRCTATAWVWGDSHDNYYVELHELRCGAPPPN